MEQERLKELLDNVFDYSGSGDGTYEELFDIVAYKLEDAREVILHYQVENKDLKMKILWMD